MFLDSNQNDKIISFKSPDVQCSETGSRSRVGIQIPHPGSGSGMKFSLRSVPGRDWSGKVGRDRDLIGSMCLQGFKKCSVL